MGISPAAQAAWDALVADYGPTGWRITSAYRDPEHNRKVGGAKNSQHIHGNAFDIVLDERTPEATLAFADAAKRAGFSGYGFYSPGSIHVDVGPGRYWGPSYGGDSLPDWAAEWVRANVDPNARGAPGVRPATTGGGSMQPQEQGRGILGGGGWDDEKRAMIALALSGMSMRPNTGLQTALAAKIDNAQKAKATNRTAQWLAQNGRQDLADAIINGGVPASTALSQFYTKASGGAAAADDAMAKARQISEMTGLAMDTPIIQSIIFNDGKIPANFAALDAQAVAAGYERGSDGYKNFMATRGSGEQAAAAAQGKAAGEALPQLQAAIVQIESVDSLVTQVLNDPDLDQMIGPVNVLKPNITGDARRVQGLFDQLSGAAYMQARTALRGGGEITENEAARAEAAMSRMQSAIGTNPEEFKKAVREFQQALRDGARKLAAAANTNLGASPSANAPAIPGMPTDATAPPPAATGPVRLKFGVDFDG